MLIFPNENVLMRSRIYSDAIIIFSCVRRIKAYKQKQKKCVTPDGRAFECNWVFSVLMSISVHVYPLRMGHFNFNE